MPVSPEPGQVQRIGAHARLFIVEIKTADPQTTRDPMNSGESSLAPCHSAITTRLQQLKSYKTRLKK